MTVYGVATVLTLLLDMSYTDSAVLVLMGVTIAYDVLGGMRAVVISDVVQMLLIVAAVAVSHVVFLAVEVDLTRRSRSLRGATQALDFNWGVQEGEAYGFWPMLIGGFFLYAAYYGCDQSQAQRVLAARSVQASQPGAAAERPAPFPAGAAVLPARPGAGGLRGCRCPASLPGCHSTEPARRT